MPLMNIVALKYFYKQYLNLRFDSDINTKCAEIYYAPEENIYFIFVHRNS